jgi:hypothetical protein
MSSVADSSSTDRPMVVYRPGQFAETVCAALYTREGYFPAALAANETLQTINTKYYRPTGTVIVYRSYYTLEQLNTLASSCTAVELHCYSDEFEKTYASGKLDDKITAIRYGRMIESTNLVTRNHQLAPMTASKCKLFDLLGKIEHSDYSDPDVVPFKQYLHTLGLLSDLNTLITQVLSKEEPDIAKWIAEGKQYQFKHDGLVNAVCAKAGSYTLFGLKAAVVDANVQIEAIGEQLCVDHDLAVITRYDHVVGQYRYTFYTTNPRVNVLELATAQKFKAGGTSKVCGFVATVSPADFVLLFGATFL